MKYKHRNGTYTITLKKTRSAKTELYRDGLATHPASYKVLVNGIEVGALTGYCKTRIKGNPSGHYLQLDPASRPGRASGNLYNVAPRGHDRRVLNNVAVQAYLYLTSGGFRHPENARTHESAPSAPAQPSGPGAVGASESAGERREPLRSGIPPDSLSY